MRRRGRTEAECTRMRSRALRSRQKRQECWGRAEEAQEESQVPSVDCEIGAGGLPALGGSAKDCIAACGGQGSRSVNPVRGMLAGWKCVVQINSCVVLGPCSKYLPFRQA